jgi:caa(3)-type oxidase subunit IV
MNNNKDESKQQELAQGVGIFLILTVLTVIEYFLGTRAAVVPIMWLIALLKAGLVLWFFMHVKRAFKDEGGH